METKNIRFVLIDEKQKKINDSVRRLEKVVGRNLAWRMIMMVEDRLKEKG